MKTWNLIKEAAKDFESLKMWDLLQDFIDKGIRMQEIYEAAQQKAVLSAQNNARTGELSRNCKGRGGANSGYLSDWKLLIHSAV